MTEPKIEIVVGVDNLGAYRPVVELLDRLRFPAAHLTLVHAASEKIPFASAFGDLEGIEERYAEVTTNLGQAALHEASALLSAKSMLCRTLLTHGPAAARLVEESETHHADLIAVNAMRRGAVGANSIGSISAALAVTSTASVLVAKGERAIGGTFRAIFATDHSAFAARCLDRLIRLSPKGIDEIVVLSAWEIDNEESALLGTNLAMLGGDVDRWVEESVEASSDKARRQLEAAGYKAGTMVAKGSPNDVIDKAMTDFKADLLIVGSQGSGAMSRSLLGSVSLHQVVSGSYPVLIIRPTEAP